MLFITYQKLIYFNETNNINQNIPNTVKMYPKINIKK